MEIVSDKILNKCRPSHSPVSIQEEQHPNCLLNGNMSGRGRQKMKEDNRNSSKSCLNLSLSLSLSLALVLNLNTIPCYPLCPPNTSTSAQS